LAALSVSKKRTENPKGVGYLSGEELSRTLGVSRTAIWKHIRALQKKGYKIAGVPSKGYTLLDAPDVLSQSEILEKLRDQALGTPVFFYESIGSTNDQAMEVGDKGGPEGALFLAETQTHGKGRLGRRWISPPGVNLYISVLLRPRFPPMQAPVVTLMAAVALAEAIIDVTGLDAWIKWPNDILIQGKKVAGILTEMHAEQDTIHYLVVGVGINVNLDPETLPEDIRAKSTSLKSCLGEKVDRTELLCRFLECLARDYGVLNQEGPPAIFSRWDAFSRVTGRRVRVSAPRERIEGQVEGISSEGALIVRLPDGNRRDIFSGDVEILET
jgi:BirA family biotin operon repressor/biotin-[acetyl-CoA-carboxylase] ligase